MKFCYSCGQQLGAGDAFCKSCGGRQQLGPSLDPNLKMRTPSTQFSQLASVKRVRPFSPKAEWFFWVYIFGYVTHRMLSSDVGVYQLVAFLNLVEVVAFIVGFSRARHNWLVIWNYALIFSLLLTWVGYITGRIIWLNDLSAIASVLWIGVVGLLVHGYLGLSRRLGLDPWKFQQSNDSW